MLGLFLSILLSIYHPPVSYDISLAGNFGEPRPHHFHGGIDIKTDGVEGKAIYAIGDGYVSRVTMGLYGFGNAVYVTHPEGYTSVYCHLKAFSPRIKAALRRYQYQHETSEGDAYFSALECPVSQGQLIALSGNTGNSMGPHLHLEIHDTETWDMLDPYDFISDYLNDTIPPMVRGLMACPQAGEGVVNGKSERLIIRVSDNQPSKLKAWGKVGFALWANDYMQNSNNHFGIRETLLMVDSQTVFSAMMERIPVACNRLVNSWGNYDFWLKTRVWFLKSYVEPGNTLPFLCTQKDRGVIDFNEERDYVLTYILRDYIGNERRYSFTVKGEKTKIPELVQEDGTFFRWNQTNSYSMPGMHLIVPCGLLTKNTLLKPISKVRSGKLSDSYRFYPTSCPLVASGEISFFVSKDVDVSKIYVAHDGVFAGGEYHDGWVTGRVDDLGAWFELASDNEAPEVTPVNLGDHIVLKLTDAKSGIASYRATIDGKFVVFDKMDKKPFVMCDLSETPIRKTLRTHQLRFTAIDNRNNEHVYETNIIY